MRTIKASEFKAKCLQLIDSVATTGEPIEITKRGKPVATLVMHTSVPKEDNWGKFQRVFPESMRLDGDTSLDPDFSIWNELGGFDAHMEQKFGSLWKDKQDAVE